MYNNVIVDLSKKVSFDYIIKNRYECGVVLFGTEVRSVRYNSFNIVGSYVSFKNFESWLIGSSIKTLSLSNDYERRERKLLFHKKEIRYLFGMLKMKGFTLVPSKVYWKNSFIKVEVSLCIGKKKYDKRLSLKRKEWDLKKMQIIKCKNFS